MYIYIHILYIYIYTYTYNIIYIYRNVIYIYIYIHICIIAYICAGFALRETTTCDSWVQNSRNTESSVSSQRAHRQAIYTNGNQANEIKQKTQEQPASRTAATGSKPTTTSAEAHIPISPAGCKAVSRVGNMFVNMSHCNMYTRVGSGRVQA